VTKSLPGRSLITGSCRSRLSRSEPPMLAPGAASIGITISGIPTTSGTTSAGEPGPHSHRAISNCDAPARSLPKHWRGSDPAAATSSDNHPCQRQHERRDHPPGGSANFEINPMDHSRATRLQNLMQAPRCGARTRSGSPCQRPAIRGRKRCRLHGGLSPGAPRGEKNGNFKTGDWTLEAIEERNWLRSLVRSFGPRNEENQ
jgi:hypothetical protein